MQTSCGAPERLFFLSHCWQFANPQRKMARAPCIRSAIFAVLLPEIYRRGGNEKLALEDLELGINCAHSAAFLGCQLLVRGF
jgi:hypothetical protein